VSFLLDTNVVSEWTKPVPDQGVMAWMKTTDEDRVYLSVITLAELRNGVERLPQDQRRARPEHWLDHELPERFSRRILGVDERVAHAWGRLVARARSAGRPIGIMDAFVAATAEVAGLAVVTRNVSDFVPTGISVHNPWSL
jgi:predicted nucleic acid-binding protein